jgi:hypothetical protein
VGPAGVGLRAPRRRGSRRQGRRDVSISWTLQLSLQTIELRDAGGRETFDHFGASLQPRYRLVAADPYPTPMRCASTSPRCGR